MRMIDQRISGKLFDMGMHSKYSLFYDTFQSWIPKKPRYLIIAYSDKNKNSFRLLSHD